MLQLTLDALKAKLSAFKQETASLQSMIDDYDTRINAINDQLQVLKARNLTNTDYYNELQSQLKSLEQEKSQLKSKLDDVLNKYDSTFKTYEKLAQFNQYIDSVDKALEELDSISFPKYNPYPPGTDLHNEYDNLLQLAVDAKITQTKLDLLKNAKETLEKYVDDPNLSPYIAPILSQLDSQINSLSSMLDNTLAQYKSNLQRYNTDFNEQILQNPNIPDSLIQMLQNVLPSPENISLLNKQVYLNDKPLSEYATTGPMLSAIPSPDLKIIPTKTEPTHGSPSASSSATDTSAYNTPDTNTTYGSPDLPGSNTLLPSIPRAHAATQSPTENILAQPDVLTKASTNYSQIPLQEVIYGLPEIVELQVLGEQIPFKWDNNFVVAEIFVGEMKYNGSSSMLNAWDFVDYSSKFLSIVMQILSYAGVSPSKIGHAPFKFALQHFSAQDVITNSYGESTFQEVNNTIGSLARDFAYLSGGNWDAFKKMLSSSLKEMFGPFGEVATFMGSTLDKILGAIPMTSELRQKFANSFAGQLLSGKRVDVPKVWHDSTCSMTYNMKIRLSASIENRQELIDMVITPLTMLLVMSAPRADRTYMYRWPWVLNVNIKGHGYIPMGVVTEIQVLRPGDLQIFTHQGRFLNIDVILSIQPIYNTLFTYTASGSPGSARWMLTVNEMIKKIVEGLKL